MSEYYKQIREIIFREYKYWGIGIKAEKLLYTWGAISSFFIAIILITNSKRTGIALKLYLIIGCISLLGSIWCKSKYRSARRKAIISVIDKLDLDIEIVSLVSKELEEYIKRVQVFATWFIGVTVTFIILFITLFANYCFKCFDALIKLGNDEQIKEWVSKEFVNATFVESALGIGGYLFIIVIVFVLFFYSIFSIIILVKKEVLYFLYDIRYRLLMKEEQKEKLEEEILKTNFLNKFHLNDLFKR